MSKRFSFLFSVFLLSPLSCKTTEDSNLANAGEEGSAMSVIGCWDVASANRSNETEVGSATSVCIEYTPDSRSGDHTFKFKEGDTDLPIIGVGLTSTMRCPNCYKFSGISHSVTTDSPMGDFSKIRVFVTSGKTGEKADFTLTKQAPEESSDSAAAGKALVCYVDTADGLSNTDRWDRFDFQNPTDATAPVYWSTWVEKPTSKTEALAGQSKGLFSGYLFNANEDEWRQGRCLGGCYSIQAEQDPNSSAPKPLTTFNFTIDEAAIKVDSKRENDSEFYSFGDEGGFCVSASAN